MPLPAANALQQVAALQRLIKKRSADGKVTGAEARGILGQARRENVQGGELELLRSLANSKTLDARARPSFVRGVDQVVPAGAPTAQLAAILFRVDPNTGRRQLLSLLDRQRNPVPGGPKTFVVTGLGAPYLAGITTGQITSGLVKFLEGASASDARRIRHYLGQQLRTLELPVSRGGLSIPAIRGGKGLNLSVDTRVGSIGAVNQNAVVLKSLEKVMQLDGPENRALAARGKRLASRMARELRSQLEFAYPRTGRLSYSVAVRGGRPVSTRAEDGAHLKTTLDAIGDMTVFGGVFSRAKRRMDARFPELRYASPADLSGNPGEIYTPRFGSFVTAARAIARKPTISARDLARLEAQARADGLTTSGEKKLIASLAERVK